MRVLLVYADRVGRSMGGVGIRACELARVLGADGHDVTIAAAEHDGSDVGAPVVTFSPHAPRGLRGELAAADAIVAQPQWPLLMRRMARSGARLVFDLYDPEAFGTLEHFADRAPRLRRTMAAYAVDRLQQSLRIADHVGCASERQRDLWLGALLASGLVTAEEYDRDPSLRSRLDVVAYGVPEESPQRRPDAAGARAALGLEPDDELVLWNGGVWSWLDAPTAVRAVALLRKRRPSVRLGFMGSSDAAPARRAEAAARAVADELDELGSGVLFHDAWVPYAERAGWLLDASCALSAHVDHLETRFASRTRLLDCFWAGLPVVCTAGDELAARVEREDLGEAVPAADPMAMAAAIESVLDRGRAGYAPRLAAAARELSWERVSAPLRRWLSEPAPPPRPRPRLGGRRPGELVRTGGYLAATGLGASRLVSIARSITSP